MKRSIPRSLISKAMAPATEPAEKEETDAPAPVPTPAAFRGASAGAGSAWKSGALAQSQATLERNREQLIEDILSGRHELALSPDQISDPLGTDRRSDWVEQEAFATLVRSIEENGQDTPILVWPEDPEWRPDPLDPTNAEGVRFIMLTGRRRHAAAEKLGRKLRVILGPAEARKKADNRFEMLFLRFRENEERENSAPSNACSPLARCMRRFGLRKRRSQRWHSLAGSACMRALSPGRGRFSGRGTKS